MAYRLQLLRDLIDRHPEKAGKLALHVESLERSIDELPLTCLSNVRTLFEAMHQTAGASLSVDFGNADDFPQRNSILIKALDLSLGDHPHAEKIDTQLKKLLGSMNGAASALAALSNIPNMRHGGALDWPTLERQHAYMLGGLCDALVSFLLDVAWNRPANDEQDEARIIYEEEPDFNETLDIDYQLVEIAGSAFEPSRVLFALDPLQYESAREEWRLAREDNASDQEAAA